MVATSFTAELIQADEGVPLKVKLARAGRWRDVQRDVMDNAVLFSPVSGTSLWAWQPRVEGFAPNFSASEYFYWARLRVKASE